MDDYNRIEEVVRSTFASVVWSHKIQEKQADIYAVNFKRMETIKIIAASLTSVGVISLIFTNQLWIKLAATVLSFITIFVNSFFKSFDLQKMIVQHKRTANELISIRGRLMVLLLQIRLKQDPIMTICDSYKQIMEDLDRVYLEAPNTTDMAVKKAGVALCENKDNTFSDEEIDLYLPKSLRKDTA